MPKTARPRTDAPAPKTQRAPSVYQHHDYKEFVRAVIAAGPNGGRGLRRHLAEALRCQVAFVSHVLAGQYHFSAEQAEAAARYFGLAAEDAEFFLLLVSENRAATPGLRALYGGMLSERRAAREQLQNRIKIHQKVDREDQATYYSHWHYAAVHMALTVPGLRTPEALRRRLGLSAKTVAEVLKFLTDTGLARFDGSRYQPGAAQLHLDRNSPFVARHHANWRLAAMQSLAKDGAHDFHYSAVVSCSEADLPKVRERIAKCVEDCMEIIKTSGEEKLVGLCLDWFEV